MKLVDRGDEIFVDTSELLTIDQNLRSVPAFAQPFRLHGFDESVRTKSSSFNRESTFESILVEKFSSDNVEFEKDGS